MNVLFNRRLKYDADPNSAMVTLFRDLEVDHVIISGDITTTALKSEFAVGRAFAHELEANGMRVHAIPGNHDTYTRWSERHKIFYRYFERAPRHGFSMKDDKVGIKELDQGWWFIGVDTTVATRPFSAIGKFTPAIEAKLEEALAFIPQGDRVVLVNHFPMFNTIHHSHDMQRCDALRALLVRHPEVKLYLHGHVHRQSITDHRSSGLPIILNSGSCGFKRRPTLHVIDLTDAQVKIRVYAREKRGNDQGQWLQREEAHYYF